MLILGLLSTDIAGTILDPSFDVSIFEVLGISCCVRASVDLSQDFVSLPSQRFLALIMAPPASCQLPCTGNLYELIPGAVRDIGGSSCRTKLNS